MKQILFLGLAVLMLSIPVQAVDLSEEILDALPEQAEELLEDVELTNPEGFSEGVQEIVEKLSGKVQAVLRQRLRGAASVLLVVVLCGVVAGLYEGSGSKKIPLFLQLAGTLSITGLTAGSLDSLMGMGYRTIGELNTFSKALLPTLAAATAASGAVTSATLRQVVTVFCVDLLMSLIHKLLMPMVYLYTGVLAAGACFPENRLGALAQMMKKIIVWMLTTALLLFTLYLSVAGIFSGVVDGSAVKVAKATISGVVPVVGGIIAEASETVLAGAGLLRGSLGVCGVLVILAACSYPFLQLGIQYLLYKLAAFLAAVIGAPALCRLIDGLGGAFGMVLGMTGSCALLLLVSILASVAAVIP